MCLSGGAASHSSLWNPPRHDRWFRHGFVRDSLLLHIPQSRLDLSPLPPFFFLSLSVCLSLSLSVSLSLSLCFLLRRVSVRVVALARYRRLFFSRSRLFSDRSGRLRGWTSSSSSVFPLHLSQVDRLLTRRRHEWDPSTTLVIQIFEFIRRTTLVSSVPLRRKPSCRPRSRAAAPRRAMPPPFRSFSPLFPAQYRRLLLHLALSALSALSACNRPLLLMAPCCPLS